MCPSGHPSHTEAFAAVAKNPGAQAEHAVQSRAGAKCPGAHSRGKPPLSSQNEPGGQCAHAARPVLLANRPSAHSTHAVALRAF